MGDSAEDTIRDFSQIGAIGVPQANDTMLDIMIGKYPRQADTEDA